MFRALAVVVLTLTLGAIAPCGAQGLPVQEHVLRNGMHLWLVPRHEEPSISGGWVAHVGSADEAPGHSGLTHLVEHLMFKGTRTIGKQNKSEFHQIYLRHGASDLNALTGVDMTQFFVTLPRRQLELWFWMESERLLRPVFRDFDTEQKVVLLERRQRIESLPLGLVREAYGKEFWGDHPYGRPITGWPAEVRSLTLPEAQDYFRRHYAPAEVTAVLVGDFDPAAALHLAQRYLGRIPPSVGPSPPPPPQPPRKPGERRFTGVADTASHLEISFRTVPFAHPDSYPLQVLALLLGGRAGRFYRHIVVPGIGVQITARQESLKHDGLFTIESECTEGKSIAATEKAVFAEVLRLREEPMSPRELLRVKNQFAVASLQRLSGNLQILLHLLNQGGLGGGPEINEGWSKIQAVSAKDVQRVARTYLLPDRSGVARYTRKGTQP